MTALWLVLALAARVQGGQVAAPTLPAAESWPGAIAGALRDPEVRGQLDAAQLAVLEAISRPSLLEPLITQLELTQPSWPLTQREFAAFSPAQKAVALGAAINAARADANGRAETILDQLRRGEVPESAMRARYSQAERLVLLESPYLDRDGLDGLKSALPRMLARARAYEANLTAGRIQAVYGELEVQAPLVRPDENPEEGGLMEAPPKEGLGEQDGYDGFLDWEDRPQRHLNEESGLGPAIPDEHAVSSDHRYDLPAFKRLAAYKPYDVRSREFPLDAVLRRWRTQMRQAAQKGWARRFWSRAGGAYRKFDRFVQAHLRLISSIGRLGPAAKATLMRLRMQNERLFGLIEGIAAEHELPGRYGLWQRNDPMTWLNHIRESINRVETSLTNEAQRQDDEADLAYEFAEAAREDKSPRSLVKRLAALERYYRRRLAAAQADPDPGHLRLLLTELRAGVPKWGPKIMQEDFTFVQELIPSLPSLSRLIELRALAARRGAGRDVSGWTVIVAGAVASAAVISTIFLALAFPVVAALSPLPELAAVFLVGWLGYSWTVSAYRAWRFRRLGGLLAELRRLQAR